MPLTELGWTSYFESFFEEYRPAGHIALRVVKENRGIYNATDGVRDLACEVTGKFAFNAEGKGAFPAVGDWVVATEVPNEPKAMIHAVLPRKSAFIRNVAGETTDEQVVAANVDTVFIITGLDLNFNLRRIERYLALAWESRAVPVIVLNKSDICDDIDAVKKAVESIAFGVDVVMLSARLRNGLDEIQNYCSAGKTVAFIGSSGVGKSTIINALLGTDRLQVNEVSDLGSRGRHTTTFRELIVLPEGGMVIDTPGMREIQVRGEDAGLGQTFGDIEELSGNCRFKNCSHENEPGCAVRDALQSGALEPKRFENYLKLKREFAWQADRQTMKASAIERSRWKNISKYAKTLKKDSR